MDKKLVHIIVKQQLQQKVSLLKEQLQQLSDAAESESKSTAGDKHETGRAMVQIEQEKLSKQLSDVIDQQEILEKIDVNRTTERVVRGSLVETDKGLFFISIPLGKILVDAEQVFVISPESPLGKQLLGKRIMDKAEMNGSMYIISKVS